MTEESSELLTDSTLRGILLVGALGMAGYVAYKIWLQQKSLDSTHPSIAKPIRVPIELPFHSVAKK